jgi:hypothetical protein
VSQDPRAALYSIAAELGRCGDRAQDEALAANLAFLVRTTLTDAGAVRPRLSWEDGALIEYTRAKHAEAAQLRVAAILASRMEAGA